MKIKKVLGIAAALSVLLSLVSCGDENKKSSSGSAKSEFYDTYGYSPDSYDKLFGDDYWAGLDDLFADEEEDYEDWDGEEEYWDEDEDFDYDAYYQSNSDDDDYEYGSYYEDDDYDDYYDSDDGYSYNYDSDSDEYYESDEESSQNTGHYVSVSSNGDYDYGDTADFTKSADQISGPLSTAKKNAKWTFMIYLCGSDLESQNDCGTVDLDEILKADLGNNVNVVIQTGGANKWNSKYGISNKYLQRWVVQNHKLVKVDQIADDSMGKASVMCDFITWAAKAYPAEKTVFEFWNHGSGSVYGVCFDEQHRLSDGNSDSLKIAEIRKALATADMKFEAFFFDTCLCSTVEMANALAPYGKYQISSEEVLMSGCVGYKTFLTALAKYPNMTGADLGKQITSIYQKSMDEIGYGSEATMSCIDLSKIGAVQKAFENMASSMTKKTENVTALRNLVRQGQKAVRYGSNSESEGYTNLVDLGDFADKASSEVPSEARAVINAIKAAVISETHGSNKKNSTGIAVYYPVSYNGDTDEYAKNVNNMPYLMYLDAILDQWSAPKGIERAITKRGITPVKSSNYEVKFNTSIVEDEDSANFALKITSGLDIIDTVNFNLYMYDEEENELIYLGNDNDILCDWKKGEFKDNFAGTWLTICGNLVYAELTEELKDGTKSKKNFYTIPIKLNGKETNIRAAYDFDSNEYSIIGLTDGSQGGAASKGYKKLHKGDKIIFTYNGVKIGTEEEIEYFSDEVVYDPATFILEDSELEAGTYFYEFEIEDIFGNTKTSELAEMTYGEDGTISLSEVED